MVKEPKATRWRALPPALPEACASLVVGLRELKDRSGLTLAELADLTALSKSSWERYLNGKQFPPRHAVEASAWWCARPTPALWTGGRVRRPSGANVSRTSPCREASCPPPPGTHRTSPRPPARHRDGGSGPYAGSC